MCSAAVASLPRVGGEFLFATGTENDADEATARGQKQTSNAITMHAEFKA